MEKPQEWNPDKLARFLENAPQYTSIEFTGKLIPDHIDLETSIPEISCYCPICKTDRLFHIKQNPGDKLASLNRLAYASSHTLNLSPSSRNPKTGFLSFAFHCSKVGCDVEKRIFMYYTHEELVDEKGVPISHVTLTKCGEYPSQPPRVDQAILNVFPEDEDLLHKAVCCLKEGFGVGAYAYLRQVLESHIGLLIDEIEKNAKELGDIEKLQQLSLLHGNGPMGDKIQIANEALPTFLLVNGKNPLGRLYKTLSEGIHNLSDNDCLEKAKDVFEAITFILNTLAVYSANRKAYETSLKSLN